MKILVKKIDGIQVPTQARPDDAAYDIVATSPPNIVGKKCEWPIYGQEAWLKIDYVEYKTNLFISPQDEVSLHDPYSHQDGETVCDIFLHPIEVRQKFHTLIFSRSSISKKNLSLANSVGLIDSGYRGELLFRFKYIMQPEDLIYNPPSIYCVVNPANIYKQGEKIGQIMAQPNVLIEFELADELDQTVRGSGGFGSTNK